ncbi:MAG: glycosyl hydrolase [Armatimonadota bacterium]
MAMRMRMKFAVMWFALLSVISFCKAQVSPAALQRAFRQPPSSAKPHTWWHWVNGNVTKEGITADLESLAKAGIGGVQLFNVDVGVPNGPVKFFSREWFDLFRHAVQEAGRLGLEFCVHNCAGWSSSGGPWVKPEHAMQMVVTSQIQVKGPTKFANKLPQPKTRAGYYRDIAVLAFPTPKGNLRIENLRARAAYERANNIVPPKGIAAPPEAVIRLSSIVDLTNRLQPDGRLEWDVPEGDWTILRIGHTPTGKGNHPAPQEGRGLEVDKMSREALDAFWKSAIEPLLREVGPLASKVFNNVLVDSYEVGCQNWTPKFREEFRKRRGYDLLPYLPVLAGYVVESVEVSERFLWDYRRTIADLFAENYYGYFAELCRKHGLLFSTEPYGNGPFEDLVCGGHADIPMGEFWVGANGGMESCKLAASAAHVYGKPIVGAEAFTASPEHGRWQTHPYMLKAIGDRVFCEGINRFIFHTTAHQPWFNVLPAMTMGPWGSHFGRTQTWWENAKAWVDYLTRCQFLLQQGTFVADILFFVGEHAPNSAPYRPDLKAKGYDYDACPTEVLMRAKVRNGKVVLPSGMSYEVLVLPDADAMTPQVLRKIRELVSAGATIIGPKPTRSPSLQGYPQCDAEVQKLANEIWGNLDGKTATERNYGKGKVYWGKTIEQVLDQKGVKPDFEFKGSGFASIAWIHRRIGNLDIYFVANQRERWETVECVFRARRKVPEIWHPDTGEVERAPAFWESDNRTVVLLQLPPYGSVFVVFQPDRRPVDAVVSFQRNGSNAWLPERAPTKRLEIRRAIYGVLNDPNRCVDVTKQLQGMVRDGELVVQASNAIAGDPAPFIVKQLRVDYALDGEERTVIVREGEVLQIPEGTGILARFTANLRVNERGQIELVAWQSGTYEIKTRTGKKRTITVKSVPEPLALDDNWEVRFPPNWDAPEVVRFERLISWSQHPDAGVRHFSGTATYVREFEIPKDWFGTGKTITLDLGIVRHIAEVRLNGISLGVQWKPPFRWDITKFVKPGRNRLEVLVTNTWVNRLIGDEELPDDCEWHPDGRLRAFPQWFVEGKSRPSKRLTFTTWKHYRKGAPLEEAGLLGPVRIIVGVRQPL